MREARRPAGRSSLSASAYYGSGGWFMAKKPRPRNGELAEVDELDIDCAAVLAALGIERSPEERDHMRT